MTLKLKNTHQLQCRVDRFLAVNGSVSKKGGGNQHESRLDLTDLP